MELTKEMLREWQYQRFLQGQKKYGNAHLHRNGIDDAREELIDAMNICDLIDDRIEVQRLYSCKFPVEELEPIWEKINTLRNMVELTLVLCDQLENMMPKELLTDEEGGGRVFITEWRKNNE